MVPGCGRGYDCVALAEKGYEVVGLELSETAAKAAREYIAGSLVGRKIKIITGDFFTSDLARAFGFRLRLGHDVLLRDRPFSAWYLGQGAP